MDRNFENVNQDILKEYVGEENILEINTMVISGITNSPEGIECRPYLLKAREKIDGTSYYNLEVLRIGYGKLNPENLPVKYVKQNTDAE